MISLLGWLLLGFVVWHVIDLVTLNNLKIIKGYGNTFALRKGFLVHFYWDFYRADWMHALSDKYQEACSYIEDEERVKDKHADLTHVDEVVGEKPLWVEIKANIDIADLKQRGSKLIGYLGDKLYLICDYIATKVPKLFVITKFWVKRVYKELRA